MKKTSDSGIQTGRAESAARGIGELFFCRCIPAALGFASAAYAAAISARLSFPEMVAGLKIIAETSADWARTVMFRS